MRMRRLAADAVVRDISARKEAEQALFANRNLLQTLIESAGAVIYVFDTDGRLKLCNPQFETLCGRSRGHVGPAARRFATGHCRRTRRQRPASDAQRRPA